MLPLELSELDYQFLYVQFMGNNVEKIKRYQERDSLLMSWAKMHA